MILKLSNLVNYMYIKHSNQHFVTMLASTLPNSKFKTNPNQAGYKHKQFEFQIQERSHFVPRPY